MHLLGILFTVWAVAAAAWIGLLLYQSQLTRHETNELFLHDEPLQPELDEVTLVRRLEHLKPAMRAATGAFAVMSLLVVGTYVAQLLPGVRL